MERNVLGKGLSALIPEGAPKDRVQTLPIDQIRASEFQPRQYFSDDRLKELSESIRQKGVIQPILVRPSSQGGYELIAGERRLRAVQLLGQKEIPAIIKQVENGDLLEISLIENIQREELSKIEEAKAYRRLSDEFGLTHEIISQRVSKERSTISNILRLLELPEKIQRFLEESTITMGHARTLLALGDEKKQMRFCDEIVKKGLSVRQVESLVKREQSGKKIFSIRGKKDPNLAAVEESLQHRYGTRVKISQGKKRGKIVIDFFSTDDLNRILNLLVP